MKNKIKYNKKKTKQTNKTKQKNPSLRRFEPRTYGLRRDDSNHQTTIASATACKFEVFKDYRSSYTTMPDDGTQAYIDH